MRKGSGAWSFSHPRLSRGIPGEEGLSFFSRSYSGRDEDYDAVEHVSEFPGNEGVDGGGGVFVEPEKF